MQWPVYANNIIIYLDSNGISYLVKSHDDLLPYTRRVYPKIFEGENFQGFLSGLESLVVVKYKWQLMNVVIIKSL